MADMSGDKKLQAPYLTGDDLYVRMAMDLYKFDREYCVDGAYDPTNTFKPRGRAKTGLLAALYLTSKFTLAQQMRISVDEAEAFLDNFFKTYVDVKRFIDETQAFVLEHEYVETMFQRKRRFPGLKKMMAQRKQLEKIPYKKMTSEQREQLKELRKNTNGILRAACNARIQGSAADVMKLILAALYKHCQQKGWRMICTIHDQADILVPDTITIEEVEEVNRIMTETVKLVVPLACDTTLGYTWADEIPYKKFFAEKADTDAA